MCDLQEFVSDYLLTMKVKECEDQENLPTEGHVRHKVIIKSPVCHKKLKIDYFCNPQYHEVDICEVLSAISSDCQAAYCEDAAGFADEFGYEEFREATRIWGLIVEEKEKAERFFGESLLEKLYEAAQDY